MCYSCVFTLVFVARHAWAGLFHSPGSFRRAQYRWFIPPNLSCTVAGCCLPSSQRQGGSISLRHCIDYHRRYSYRASYRGGGGFLSELTLRGRRARTSSRRHMFDPAGRVKANSESPVMPLPRLLTQSHLHSPPRFNVHRSGVAGKTAVIHTTARKSQNDI